MRRTNGDWLFEEALIANVPARERWNVRRAARFLERAGKQFLVDFGVVNARAVAERVGRERRGDA